MPCLLSDSQIRDYREKKDLIIEPFSNSVEPASYDLRMGNRVYSLTRGSELQPDVTGKFIVYPRELILIESMEKVGFPKDLQGRVCSKVSLLKKGLSSISTKIDPGYGWPDGWHLLIVFSHCGHEPIELKPGDPICSMEIEKLDVPASKLYSSERPKEIPLRPLESIDPLAQKPPLDFRELEKTTLEKFYGHPLDDLFLAVGKLQISFDKIEKRLPRPRPIWQIAFMIYLIYFATCSLVLWNLFITFPPLIAMLIPIIAIIGIGATIIG
ncbi:MAG: hypothetical protein H3Z52_08740, partial [archaeon]|nr:hypothetical protein [archaeon]